MGTPRAPLQRSFKDASAVDEVSVSPAQICSPVYSMSVPPLRTKRVGRAEAAAAAASAEGGVGVGRVEDRRAEVARRRRQAAEAALAGDGFVVEGGVDVADGAGEHAHAGGRQFADRLGTLDADQGAHVVGDGRLKLLICHMAPPLVVSWVRT